MDITLSKAKQDLSDRLADVGRRLNETRDPEIMKNLIGLRKRLQSEMSVMRAAAVAARTGR